MVEPTHRITDAIPRVSIEQLLNTLHHLATQERSTFEEVRWLLQNKSKRRAPSSREAMWTTARDALAELQRLSLAKTGPLPRKRSEVDRLRESPCEATADGRALAELHSQRIGTGFDRLLLRWTNEHPYFRAFLARLAARPIHVPDITSVKQLGDVGARSSAVLERRLVESCVERLRSVGWADDRLDVLERQIVERLTQTLKDVGPTAIDAAAKGFVDLIQDGVVLPAFLAAEALPFDVVTFQHINRVAQEFLAASWTSSHPSFVGRVLFATCDFTPALADVPSTTEVTDVAHHGHRWASDRFPSALIGAYGSLAGSGAGVYVDVYSLRALVCTALGIQPKVFERCLNDFKSAKEASHLSLYSELPRRPSAKGETDVHLGDHRIGSVRLGPATA